MGATSPPRPSGRTESCTLRILTDAFFVLTGEREKEVRVEILFFAVFVKASPQDEHGVERTALPWGVGLRKPHMLSFFVCFARCVVSCIRVNS